MAALPLLNMRALGQVAKPGTKDACVLEAQAFFRGTQCEKGKTVDAPRVDAPTAVDQDCSECRSKPTVTQNSTRVRKLR
jgi:hypothetical protein